MKIIESKNKLSNDLSFKISPFKEQIKKTQPHKHEEYYELIFLHQGEGFHSIEEKKYLVNPPEFYFLKPGQLHFWQFTSIPKGFVILIRSDEFDIVNENQLIQLLNKLNDIQQLRFPAEKYPQLILEEIHREYTQQKTYSKDIIHGLLSVLFGRLLQSKDTNPHKTTPNSHFEKFNYLLINKTPHLHKVSEFAELLHITPQNLNTICRKATGKSASQIINEHILLEAKRYILHTDNSINEIAALLSFSDTSNFVKFFKKISGLTPLNFRKQYFQ